MSPPTDDIPSNQSTPTVPNREPHPPTEPTTDHQSSPDQQLTPIQAHYLKKYLIQQAIQSELQLLTSHNATLAHLGPPFRPPPNDTPKFDLPFIRYFFRQFLITFPFMAAAPKDFYSGKLQPFFESVLSRNLGPTSVFDDKMTHDNALRKKFLSKLQRHLSLLLSASTKLQDPEEVVRLSQTDLERLEKISKKRNARYAKQDRFQVNIISVRSVVSKGRVRSRAHEEFIIRTSRPGYPDIHVSRRYGDFKTLADELRKMHPTELIPPPPPKDRSTVVTTAQTQSPLSPSFSGHQNQSLFSDVTSISSTDSLNSISSNQTARISLSREKNRLTLRAYLHSLFGSSSVIASSPVVRSFITADPIQLTAQEVEDAKRREEADNVREEGRKTFANEIAARVDGLRAAIKGVKSDMMGEDGLARVFAAIKVTPDATQLPPEHQAVLEWGRISFASTIFQQFIASDRASENLANLKRIHGLMPYFMLKAALKISNPVGMIRGVLDLFMAQPFGGRSLLQRMFSSSLNEEVRAIEEDIDSVKDKIDDPVICEKVRQFVYAPKEIQDMFKTDAVAEKQNLITVILRSGDEPTLSRTQMHRVARAHRAHTAYMAHKEEAEDSDEDDGPQDEDAWLYEDIKVLAFLYSRLRDKEMILAIIFEGTTSELLKDIITIFYSPLAQVYKAANIAESLGDLQNFINDLIKTVEQVDELSQRDPGATVQAFINLVQRHQQAAYSFVHNVHAKGEDLFGSLLQWIQLFIDSIREGVNSSQPLSMEFILPQSGTTERQKLVEEVDKVTKYHYQLKLMYEDKIRKRFNRAEVDSALGSAEADDEAAQLLVSGIVGDVGFGELVRSDVNDVAAEESDGSEDYSSSEYESATEDLITSDSDTEESSDDDKELGSKALPRVPATSGVSPRHSRSQNPIRQSNVTGGRGRPSSSNSNDTVPARKRGLSLKRSLNFLKPSSPSTQSPPPVPPLPTVVPPITSQHPPTPLPPLPTVPSETLSHVANKDLPPSPPLEGSSQSHPSSDVTSPQPAPPPKKPRKRKQVRGPKPPELEHIPKLVPIFVEMMRPHLRPRQNASLEANLSRATSRPA